PGSCPEPANWRALLTGSLPEPEQSALHTHLEGCPHCQQALESMAAGSQTLHRVVAIKVMAASLASNTTARKRFTREAQAAAAVRNEHVIDIHAVEESGPLP